MRAVNLAAVKADLTQRDWVIKVLAEAANGTRIRADVSRAVPGSSKDAEEAVVQAERREDLDTPGRNNGREVKSGNQASPVALVETVNRAWEHSARTCRVYGCLMCAAAKVEK